METNVRYLGGSFPKELSDNKFMGVIVINNGTDEVAFDDDNVTILLANDKAESLLSLKGFVDNLAYLNGYVFWAKEKVITKIVPLNH